MTTKAEKEAAKAAEAEKKAAEKAEKEAAKAAEDSAQEVSLGNPQSLERKDLPLVVKLPEGASSGQVEFAKVINAYAYINPTKYELKKDELLAKLKSLEGVEVPGFATDGEDRPNRNLAMNYRGQKGSPYKFNFVRDVNKNYIPVITLT